MNPKKRNVLFARLLSYVKPHYPLVIASFGCAVVHIFFMLLSPIFIGNAVDAIVGENQVIYERILQYVLLLLLSAAISSFFQWLLTLCNTTISYRTVKDLRTQIFHKLNHVPLYYTDTTAHGDTIHRVVNDIDQVSDGLLQGLTQLFTGILSIAGTIVFLFLLHPFLATVVILLTPLSIFVASYLAKHTHHTFREQTQLQGELSGYIEEIIGGQKVVTAFGYEERAEEKFQEINQRLYRCGVKAQFYSSMTNPCTRFVNGIVYAATGVIGAFLAITTGTMSVGQIASFLSYANQYTKPFNEITGVIAQLQTAFASASRVFAVLDEQEEAEDSAASSANILLPEQCHGNVDIDHVNFSYVPERPLLHNLNLHVKSGNRVALVGPTGCGKTTVINLLMRFYEVNSGIIQVENIKIDTIPRNNLRGLYGMVLQEAWLFHGTIRENIAYGKPDATLEEVIVAAKAAYIHSFIQRLPQGYETILTEDGNGVSQGQKQLLCIARVMLSLPPMLILDEATSSIDTMTEIRIQKAFSEMMNGRTSFVVAHRLSTIREADIILVMKDGVIVEQGTHESLLQQNGFYSNLYQSQFDA